MSTSVDDSIRVVVAIDFGTTFSGYAYTHKFNPKEITVEKKWGGAVNYKTPTIITYEDETYTTVKSWGFDAIPERPPRRKKNVEQSKLIELFKLFLLKEPSMELPALPNKLDYRNAITDYLEKLGKKIKNKLNNHWKDLDFFSQVLIVLTIPAEFDDDAIVIVRDCAYKAGLTRERDSRYLIFTTEPEAATLHCLKSSDTMRNLKPGDIFMVVDCGGGKVDLTSYELLTNNRISEMTERTGGSCGSSFVDKEFINLLRRKIGNSTFELLEKDHYNILHYMVQRFCERVKLPFTGEKSGFRRYKIDLNDYPLIKDIIEEGKEKRLLIESEWSIYVEFGDVKGMFDHCITKIIDLIKGQLAQLRGNKCSAITLVGGFSESKYLQARIRKEFNKVVSNITVPSQPMIAVLMGGVQFGLQVEAVAKRVLKRTYGTDITRRSEPNDPTSQMLPDGYTIIFDTLARRGKKISINDKVVKKFKPFSLTQRSIGFDIYVTKEFDAKFCNDPGVKKLRHWEIELPENENYDDIIILFTLTFGTVEILATAETENRKTKEQKRLKYE